RRHQEDEAGGFEQPADDGQLDQRPDPCADQQHRREGEEEVPVVVEDHLGEEGGAERADLAVSEVDDACGAVDEDQARDEDGVGQPGEGPDDDDLEGAGYEGPLEAPARQTARTRSSRSSSSAAGPSKRISPFSMKTARSAMVRATFTDCSTITMVMPRSFSCSTVASSCCTTTGARPSESSSMRRISGSSSSALARASICCSPPDRVPAACFSRDSSTGNIASASARRAAVRALSRRWR